jgi:hypothetical protein
MKTFLAAFLAFLATSCTGNLSPTQTVQSAGIFLDKNQPKDFTALLFGDALTTYGTAEGFEALQRAISGLNLQVVKPTLDGQTGDIETWSVNVATQENPTVNVISTKVECQVGYLQDSKARNCYIVSIFLD